MICITDIYAITISLLFLQIVYFSFPEVTGNLQPFSRFLFTYPLSKRFSGMSVHEVMSLDLHTH